MLSICIFISLLSQIYCDDARFSPTSHANWPLLKNPTCNPETPTSRILGGEQAKLGEYPWIVGLIKREIGTRKTSYTCSGTILNKNTVLTAAHCVFFLLYGESIVSVVAGDWNKKTGSDCENDVCSPTIQKIKVKEIIVHTQHQFFLNDRNQYDIGLIRLEQDIQYNSHVSPICMVDDDLTYMNFLDKEVTVAGWGFNDPATNSSPAIIHKAKLQVKDNTVCDGKLNYVMNENQMCLSSQVETIGTCFRDGGGPIMLLNDTFTPPRTYVIGIVSAQRVPCGSSIPTIGTRLNAFYMEWLLDNLKENVKNFYVVKPTTDSLFGA